MFRAPEISLRRALGGSISVKTPSLPTWSPPLLHLLLLALPQAHAPLSAQKTLPSVVSTRAG